MENKTAKGAGMLKVVGILMIVFGGIALVLGIIAAVAVAAVAFLSEGLLTTNLLYASTALMVASAVAELVAGIVGVVNCTKPEKAGVCIVWGAIVAVLCVAGTVLNLVAHGEFNICTMAVGLVLAVQFYIGGVPNKTG